MTSKTTGGDEEGRRLGRCSSWEVCLTSAQETETGGELCTSGHALALGLLFCQVMYIQIARYSMGIPIVIEDLCAFSAMILSSVF